MADPSPPWAAGEQAAVRRIRSYARGVLRETALQVIRVNLSLEEDGHIRLADETLVEAQATCRKVAGAWSRRLAAVGHDPLVGVIRQLVEDEIDHLFDQPATTAASTRSATSTAAPPAQPTGQQMHHQTTHAQLRSLGRDPEHPLDPTTAEHLLDEMAAKGDVEWPASWSAVDRHAQAIEARLHAKPNDTVVELIPKSLYEAAIVDHTQATAAADELVLSRKRKTRARLAPPRSNTTVIKNTSSDEPRIPDDRDAKQQWHWPSVQQELDTSQLDALLHPLEPPEQEPPRSILLGALRDVGRFHYWQQHAIDSGGDAILARSTRQHRTQMRKAGKERLGNHWRTKAYGMESRARGRSRVIETVDDGNQHWLEFDLGHCLLEAVDPQSGKRKMYYFDSVEAMLLNEDKDSQDKDEDQQEEPKAASKKRRTVEQEETTTALL